MKKQLVYPFLLFVIACNNKTPDTTTNPAINTDLVIVSPNSENSTTNFTIEGKEINMNGSLLVSKDKDKLQPGAEYIVMLTTSGGPNNESITINFLTALKTGTYPVVGMSLNRGPIENSEMYGGMMGGKPKITGNHVTITECKDLGSNNLGGHKWSISGSFDEMIIPAMGIMLMDKSKNHPVQITITKGSFNNLTFDDNWDELLEKGLEQMNKK